MHEREFDRQFMQVLSEGKETCLSSTAIEKYFGVDEIIRVPETDYPESLPPGITLAHFNLPIKHDRNDLTVVLAKILRFGYFRKLPMEEKLPLLSLDGVWKAEVTGFLEEVDYDNLPKDCFPNNIGGANDVKSLQDIILSRYTRSMPELTPGEILSRGLSVTFLKLTERVSWQQ